MKRRNFLKQTALAGLSVTALAMDACTAPVNPEKKDQGEATAPTFADDFALQEITIDALQEKMRQGQYTARSIAELYLKRIAAIDQAGPSLRAVIELNPEALALADALDQERKAGRLRGPLHGIPVLIKDNIDTGDKMMTTAGSLALEGHVAAQDAFIIKQLRAAGAVILGKTNLSEWANFRSTRSCSGWSSRGGQTKNPYVLDRSPCGSSSGSGVAVAANLCAVAIGTETDGSVIAPASFCGIVGLKPTVGLLSRSGIIPISATQDTAGPMARTVRDAAVLLGALTGVDPADGITRESQGKALQDYTRFLDANGLAGKRIGIEQSLLQGHEGVVGAYRQAIEVLKKQGATVVEVELLKATEKSGDAELKVLEYEFKDGLNRYLANAKARVGSLTEVIAFNRQNEASTMPWFKQEILEASEAKGGLDSQEYRAALQKTLGARSSIDDLMRRFTLDAIAGVSIGLPGCIDLINGDYNTGFYFCSPAAMAGYPHITVPMGQVHGLPLGISLIAGAYQEPVLFTLAYAFEQATQHRVAPTFITTS